MEHRLAAILAADIVGYSHLMAEDESGTYDALRSALSEVVVPTINAMRAICSRRPAMAFLRRSAA
jgi:class 3 adenylate cyclase